MTPVGFEYKPRFWYYWRQFAGDVVLGLFLASMSFLFVAMGVWFLRQ